MKIIVAGGTGFIGSHVCQTFIESGHDVIVLSRNPVEARPHCHQKASILGWDILANNAEQTFEGVEAVVNLAGASIAGARWTPSRKQLLLDSRIDTTRELVQSIGKISEKPQVLINGSGIGFYGADNNITMTESSQAGEGFLAELSQKWEREAHRASEHGVRVICLRMGMVLGSDGGALSKMKTPFKLFVGGPIAPGTQKISWIDIRDLTRLILWLLEAGNLSGPINAVAPQSVTMNEFCQKLGKALHRPSWVPVPAFVLQTLLGELSQMLTTGQHVEPRKLTQEGFTFRYPNLHDSLQTLFAQQSS